jgi:peptide/nickel transport system substrate-binding protein
MSPLIRPRILPIALVLLAALGACKGGARAPEQEAQSAGEAKTFGGGPPGGVLVVLADREPDELNPLTYNSNPAFQAVRLMFRALARRDSTLSNYAPDLALSWNLEPDSTLVLQLRHDAKWHDGVPVTAEDVVFTIERQKDPATASPRLPDVVAVTHVEARDSFTVAVRLSRTGPYTINALLEVVPAPKHLLGDVPPEKMRFSGFGQKPVGNGFYRFRDWRAGQQLVLDANPEMPEGRASLDRVILRFIPDVNAAITELLAGQGDMMRVPADQKSRLEGAANVKLYHAPRVRPAWIAWNTRVPPLDDVRVRRALLMAIDRESIVKALFGGEGEAALSPIPSGLKEHSPSVRPIPYDPAEAKRLLDEAGWRETPSGVRAKNGKPLRLQVDYISSDLTRQDVLVAAQSMLAKVGVELMPRAYESTAWVDRLRNREFQGSLWGWGWGPGVVGPNAETVFSSKSIPPRGVNFASYSNPRVDALIDSALVTRDTTKERAIWQQLEQTLIDDAVYAPLYLDPELYAVNARIHNVKFRGIEWWEDVPYWYIPVNERLPRDRAR